MSLASQIRAYRKKTGLSQRELDQVAGIAINSTYLYENGKSEPRLSTAMNLAAALNISLDTMAEVEKPENPTVLEPPIIHCKDCEYYKRRNLYNYTCEKNMCKILKPDDFCSDAKLKKE